MPANTVEKPQEIYQIKVTLLGTDPSIWRRLLIPTDLTLEQLQRAVEFNSQLRGLLVENGR